MRLSSPQRHSNTHEAAHLSSSFTHIHTRAPIKGHKFAELPHLLTKHEAFWPHVRLYLNSLIEDAYRELIKPPRGFKWIEQAFEEKVPDLRFPGSSV